MSKINSFSKEREKLKELSPSKRLEFIWDYYKWHILITVFLIVSVVATVISLSNEKEIILSGYLFDSYYTIDQDEPFSNFSNYAELDIDTQAPYFQANLTLYSDQMETAQQFFSTIAAGHTDFLVSNPGTFLRLSYESTKYLLDLREVLTQEQLEAYADRIFYIDASVEIELNPDGGTIHLPDPYDPENMVDPVPIGINIRGGRGVDELYLGEEPVYFAVVSNAPHMDMVQTFISYLSLLNE